MTDEQKIEQYYLAKQQYYTGESIMTDIDFDNLELELLDKQLITKSVGFQAPGNKAKHLSPMLSLAKVQIFEDSISDSHISAIKNLLLRQNVVDNLTPLKGSFKQDGLAVNVLIFQNQLKQIITRGDGYVGHDITSKFLSRFPKYFQTTDNKPFTGELRGELKMSKSDFIEHYSNDYQNPRNLVSGICNDLNIDDPRVQHVSPIFFESRGSSKNLIIPEEFKIQEILFTLDELPEIYQKFFNDRKTLNTPTDGIVISFAMSQPLKHNGHDPYHAMAIKFPPLEAETEIISIESTIKKSGRITPVGILKPIDLDGSTVRRVSLYNYGNVIKNGLFPGAKIIIAKNGDIIPTVQRIVEPVFPTEQEIQDLCINYDAKLSDNGIHLLAKNGQDQQNRERFILGMYQLGFDGFGASAFVKLFTHLSGDIINMWNHSYFTQDQMIAIFGTGSTPIKFLKQRKEKLKAINLITLIYSLQYPACGWRHCEQIAKYFTANHNFTFFANTEREINIEKNSNVQYSPFGLNKSVWHAATTPSQEFNQSIIAAVVRVFTSGAKVLFPEPTQEILEGSITVELTGSPKLFGYATKEDFLKMVPTWSHTKLTKDTSYLITDDLSSNTAKMQTAKKLGIEILTYQEAVQKHSNL